MCDRAIDLKKTRVRTARNPNQLEKTSVVPMMFPSMHTAEVKSNNGSKGVAVFTERMIEKIPWQGLVNCQKDSPGKKSYFRIWIVYIHSSVLVDVVANQYNPIHGLFHQLSA